MFAFDHLVHGIEEELCNLLVEVEHATAVARRAQQALRAVRRLFELGRWENMRESAMRGVSNIRDSLTSVHAGHRYDSEKPP